MSADYAQLEMALGPLCEKIGDLGKSYEALRAFKPVLFQEAETISKLPIIGDLMPYSVALQFLISSFAPPELKLPHENMGWSLSRYTTWLDDHPKEIDRIHLFK